MKQKQGRNEESKESKQEKGGAKQPEGEDIPGNHSETSNSDIITQNPRHGQQRTQTNTHT